MQLLSGKKKRTGRPMVTKILNLAFEQFYIFPENFKTYATYYEQLSIDLWPEFQGHVKRNLRSAAYWHLPLANFGIFT